VDEAPSLVGIQVLEGRLAEISIRKHENLVPAPKVQTGRHVLMQKSPLVRVFAGDHDHVGAFAGAKGSSKFVGIPKKLLCQVSEFTMVLLAKPLEVPPICLVRDVIIRPATSDAGLFQ
jgi:hypothetical protein